MPPPFVCLEDWSSKFLHTELQNRELEWCMCLHTETCLRQVRELFGKVLQVNCKLRQDEPAQHHRCLFIRDIQGDTAFSVPQSWSIITDSICCDSRSTPNLDIGNCLLCVFHMNYTHVATVIRRKVHQGSNGYFVYSTQMWTQIIGSSET
jgi:hypothetical protein